MYYTNTDTVTYVDTAELRNNYKLSYLTKTESFEVRPGSSTSYYNYGSTTPEFYAITSTPQSITYPVPLNYKQSGDTRWANFWYGSFLVTLPDSRLSITITDYTHSSHKYLDSWTGATENLWYTWTKMTPDYYVTLGSYISPEDTTYGSLYHYYRVKLYYTYWTYYKYSWGSYYVFNTAAASSGTKYCKIGGGKVNVYGTNSDVDVTHLVGVEISVTTYTFYSPTIKTCTDAGNYKRYITVYNPNDVAMDLYYSTSKVTDGSSPTGWSTTHYGSLGAGATTGNITINDVSGTSDKYIGVYFLETSGNKKYLYHYTYISESVVSGQPTNNTGKSYIYI